MGVRPFERADADYYDWELCGFDGFVSTSHLRLQPGFHGKLYLPLWQATIPYWFVADGRRAIVIAKINTNYEMAYLGLLDPYFSPEQWPYPLALGGTLALGEAPGPVQRARSTGGARPATSTGCRPTPTP